MIKAALISITLLISCVLIHYEILSALRLFVARVNIRPQRAKLLLVILGVLCSHFLQMLVFATAYFILRDKFGLGTFGGSFEDAFSSFLYYSMETYTSLGIGDINPLGAIRMFTGLEALTGLVMISWTASFTYLEMTKYWKDS